MNNYFFVFKFPLVKGTKWGANGRDREFTVVSEGEHCMVGKFKFDVCAVVQDDDRNAKLRTVTTYAYGIGPVRYEYHRMADETFESPVTQTVNLLSYSVKTHLGRSP